MIRGQFRAFFVMLFLLMFLLSGGCSTLREKGLSGEGGMAPQAPAPRQEDSDKFAKKSMDSSTGEERRESEEVASQPAALTVRRMIIYTVNLYIDVKSLEKATKNLDMMIGESRGIIIAQSISKSGDYSRTATYTIKVPADSLTPFVDKISQLGEVSSHTKQGQDVTEEYVDSSARLENMKKEEKRYQELLNVAKTVDDMLKIEHELGRIRGDIEAMQGRLKYLEENVAMSTVNLTLSESLPGTPKKFWNIGETFQNAITALKYLVRFAISFVIYLIITVLPFVLIFWLLIRLIMKTFRSRKKKDA